MICPKCGNPTWKVDRSLTVDSAPIRKQISRKMMDQAENLVGDYTQDYVVRRRTCKKCLNRDHFIELSFSDLEEVIKLRVVDILLGEGLEE